MGVCYKEKGLWEEWAITHASLVNELTRHLPGNEFMDKLRYLIGLPAVP